MAETLKPCPFCGGEARLVVCDSEGNVHDESYEADPYSGLSYAIVHGSDDCCGECPVSTSDLLPWLYETREEATAAWNRRVERTCRIVRSVDRNPASYGGLVHRCSSCGKAFPKQFFSNGWTRLNYCPTCGARVTGVIVKEGA